MDPYKPTKSDFKVIRELLDIALEREFVQGLEQAVTTINEWRAEGPESAREHYHKVLEELHDHRKELARTYDGLNNRRMEWSMVALLNKGVLTAADFPEAKSELKDYFLRRVEDWHS